jgi:hypothetical protein
MKRETILISIAAILAFELLDPLLFNPAEGCPNAKPGQNLSKSRASRKKRRQESGGAFEQTILSHAE